MKKLRRVLLQSINFLNFDIRLRRAAFGGNLILSLRWGETLLGLQSLVGKKNVCLPSEAEDNSWVRGVIRDACYPL